ncbi:DsbA family protein [Hymenobacter sp. GOD-10R]|uniref:DsbA family protein n=1 Tax=Hymenobacter sp. GOD-10R TaxID=3093922 RepID=UPI002D792227|nr:DsbA family protein [Hymenobacter sp. GOD-10R]WRQ29669.1 DsbA family protein [Hymenobacter sp. GOD-10R]
MEPEIDLPDLLYIYDPLCSWCYGMTPVVQRIQAEFEGRVNVSILNGGMMVGEQVGPIRTNWPTIKANLATIEKVTGVRFSRAFRQLGEEGSYVQDSDLPCRALAVFRQLDVTQKRALNFAHVIQRALFEDGKDLNNPSTYDALVTPFGIETKTFQQLLATAQKAVRQEFAAVAQIGVKGFPTSILRMGSQGYLLARGFQRYEVFASGLEIALLQASEE